MPSSKLPPKDERNTTEREERYLEAVFILFGEGDKPTRDIADIRDLKYSWLGENEY